MTVEEDIVDFANALEAAAVNLKHRIAERHGVTEKRYNPENVQWVSATGSRGPYQRYPAQGEKAEQTPDYKGLLEDLKAHNGKMQRAGLFYWSFTDSTTFGRKPAKKK